MTPRKPETRAALMRRLRNFNRCDRMPFTPEHADCVCKLIGAAVREIDRLAALVSKEGLRAQKKGGRS